MARRRAPVLRNLDDRLMIAGVLSWNSGVFLAVLFAGVTGLDLMFDFWQICAGRLAPLARLAVLVVIGATLGYAERYEDEYFVVSALRYWGQGRWRVLYSGMARDGWPASKADMLLTSRGRHRGNP